jgi:hypothetical protein
MVIVPLRGVSHMASESNLNQSFDRRLRARDADNQHQVTQELTGDINAFSQACTQMTASYLQICSGLFRQIASQLENVSQQQRDQQQDWQQQNQQDQQGQRSGRTG